MFTALFQKPLPRARAKQMAYLSAEDPEVALLGDDGMQKVEVEVAVFPGRQPY